MAASGPEVLAEISGKKQVLEEVLLPSLQIYFPDSGPVPFVQEIVQLLTIPD